MAIRTRQLLIRLSEAEHERWRQMAARDGLSMANAVRRRVDGAAAEIVRREPPGQARERRDREQPTAPPELVRELGRLGNNVNQLARWANTHKSAADAVQILEALVAVEQLLETIRADHQPPSSSFPTALSEGPETDDEAGDAH